MYLKKLRIIYEKDYIFNLRCEWDCELITTWNITFSGNIHFSSGDLWANLVDFKTACRVEHWLCRVLGLCLGWLALTLRWLSATQLARDRHIPLSFEMAPPWAPRARHFLWKTSCRSESSNISLVILDKEALPIHSGPSRGGKPFASSTFCAARRFLVASKNSRKPVLLHNPASSFCFSHFSFFFFFF